MRDLILDVLFKRIYEKLLDIEELHEQTANMRNTELPEIFKCLKKRYLENALMIKKKPLADPPLLAPHHHQ